MIAPKRMISFYLDELLFDQVKAFVKANGMTLTGFFTVLLKKRFTENAKKENE